MSDRWLYGWGVGYAAIGGASLLVPLYALALGGGPFLVGLLASAAAFAGIPGALLWGRLAERANRRRPFLLVALGATAVVLALTPLATAPWLLLVVNVALWFVVSAAAPVLNLVMVDGTPESEWEARIGRLNAFQGYGWVAGIALGTGWSLVVTPLLGPGAALRALFVALAATAAVGCLVVYRFYPDPTRISDDAFRRAYRRLARQGWGAGRALRTVPYGPGRVYWGLVTLRTDRLGVLRTPLWRYLAAAGLFSVGFATFWGPIPAYLTGAGFSDTEVFVLFLVGNLGSAVTYDRVAAFAERVGPGPAQTAALAARVVLFPLVAVVAATAFGAVAVAACFLLIGVTWAVIAVTTTTLVTRLSSSTQRAEAFGLQTAVVGFGTGFGSLFGGALATQVGFLATFVAGALAVLVAVGFVLLAVPARPGATTAEAV